MRIFFLFLPFFLISCRQDPWKHTFIRSGNDKYDMAKLIYPSSNTLNGIELEMIRYEKEIYAYINVLRFELPSHGKDENTTTLIINTHDTTKTFIIPLLKGKQRARLTHICLEYLLQALELKSTITLLSGHFCETLNTSDFQYHYHAFLKKTPIIDPRSRINFELF